MPWQFRNDRQIWQQIVDVLSQRIVSGQYPAGVRIPSVRDLALEAGVNPNTMQRALACLEEIGLLTSQRNTGRSVTQDTTLISAKRDALAEQELTAFLERMRLLGFRDEEIAQRLKMKGETI